MVCFGLVSSTDDIFLGSALGFVGLCNGGCLARLDVKMMMMIKEIKCFLVSVND